MNGPEGYQGHRLPCARSVGALTIKVVPKTPCRRSLVWAWACVSLAEEGCILQRLCPFVGWLLESGRTSPRIVIGGCFWG